MKLLLDTNAYVNFKLGHPEVVEYIIQAHSILISPVVMGELMFGFRNGSRYEKNIIELRRFLSQEVVNIIPILDVTADQYSRIAATLKRKGSPVPTNDLWIEAQTIESGAELVTLDRHFEKIDGLLYRLFHP